MTTQDLVVVGAGGFGRETVDVVAALNATALNLGEEPTWHLLGVVDDDPSEKNLARLRATGVPFLGGTEMLVRLDHPPAAAIGVGLPGARRRLSQQLHEAGVTTPALVHPRAVVSPNVTVPEGTIVLAFASVGTHVTLGRHVHLNPHAVIGHDTTLGDFTSVDPNATVSGECQIGSGTLVGAGAVVQQGLWVGEDVTIDAAACVTGNVAPGMIVSGIPARPSPRF